MEIIDEYFSIVDNIRVQADHKGKEMMILDHVNSDLTTYSVF